MENKYICEYCNKSFVNKFNLKTHQNNAKYCLDLRKQDNINFQCNYCKKNLASKWSLENHYEFCVDKYKSIIYELEIKLSESEKNLQKLETQNKELLEQIKDLAKIVVDKPTTSYINNTNHNNELTDNRTINTSNNNSNNKMIENRTVNMIPFKLTPEGIKETLESKFNEKYLMKGQKGVAEFMLENVLVSGENESKKYLMKCTDPSRKVFITLDDQGKISKDVNAENLTNIISGPVKEVSHKIYQEIQDRFFQMYESVGNELEEGDKEQQDLSIENERLDHATTKVCEISRLRNNNTEFVKNLISPLSMS